MNAEGHDLSSRELIGLSGIRSKDLVDLFAQIPLSSTSNLRERASKRWHLRRDLSRIRWIYMDRLEEAALVPSPTEAKKQRNGIRKLGEDLLNEMKQVPDWSFLHPAAAEHMQAWSLERARIRRDLAELIRRQRRLQNGLASRKTAIAKGLADLDEIAKELGDLDEIANESKRLTHAINLVDQKQLRLEATQESKDSAPELIVREIVSGLEILISLLRSEAVPNEHTFLEAAAKEWLALELQDLSRKYINRSYPSETQGKPGPALRFAEMASRLVVPEGMPWHTLKYHWLRRKQKRSRGRKVA